MKLPFKVPTGITKFVGRTMLKLRKASPDICVIGGILCGAGAIVTVGVTTWKNKEKLVEDVKAIKEAKNAGKTDIPEKTIEAKNDDGETQASATAPALKVVRKLTDDERKAIWAARIDLAKDICKTYWIPTLLGISSAGLIWGGRTILRKQLSTITAAYATLMESYKNYRQKVIDEYGAEKDQEFMYGIKTVEAVDSETGEVTKRSIIDKTKNVSQYAFWFDEGEYDSESGEWIWRNSQYRGNKFYDLQKIMNAQNWFNNVLITRGWVMLGEVADFLGCKPNPNWLYTGWVYEPGKYIELGVLEGKFQLPHNKRFCDKDDPEMRAIINPNVDGYIGYIFNDIELYDRRCGKRARKRKHMPSNAEMFGEEYAKKLEA